MKWEEVKAEQEDVRNEVEIKMEAAEEGLMTEIVAREVENRETNGWGVGGWNKRPIIYNSVTGLAAQL